MLLSFMRICSKLIDFSAAQVHSDRLNQPYSGLKHTFKVPQALLTNFFAYKKTLFIQKSSGSI